MATSVLLVHGLPPSLGDAEVRAFLGQYGATAVRRMLPYGRLVRTRLHVFGERGWTSLPAHAPHSLPPTFGSLGCLGPADVPSPGFFTCMHDRPMRSLRTLPTTARRRWRHSGSRSWTRSDGACASRSGDHALTRRKPRQPPAPPGRPRRRPHPYASGSAHGPVANARQRPGRRRTRR